MKRNEILTMKYVTNRKPSVSKKLYFSQVSHIPIIKKIVIIKFQFGKFLKDHCANHFNCIAITFIFIYRIHLVGCRSDYANRGVDMGKFHLFSIYIT